MLNGSSNIKWLCRSGFYIFFPLTYTHNKANGNGIECGSGINATRHKRRLFTLPFERTKRESIWAYDKMKLLLAASAYVCVSVSACTPQLTQKQHIKERKKRTQIMDTHAISPRVFVCNAFMNLTDPHHFHVE